MRAAVTPLTKDDDTPPHNGQRAALALVAIQLRQQANAGQRLEVGVAAAMKVRQLIIDVAGFIIESIA